MHAKKMRNEIEKEMSSSVKKKKEMSSRSIATQTIIVSAVLFWASWGPFLFPLKVWNILVKI